MPFLHALRSVGIHGELGRSGGCGAYLADGNLSGMVWGFILTLQ